MDVSSEGSPTKGFPYELVTQVHKNRTQSYGFPRKAAKAAFKIDLLYLTPETALSSAPKSL